MKGSPYGEKRSGEIDMKPRMSSNFEKSGVKPGAPGLLGKILDPLGLAKKAKSLFGGKKGGTPPVDPNTAPPADPNAAAAVVPPAGVAPADPTLAAAPVDPNAAPMQMRYKDSPAKGKWDDFKKGVKRKASKAYDKASQVGMGVKKAAGEVGTYKGTYGDKPTGIGTRLGNLKKAYVKGRDTEERVDKRGGGKGKYKGGRSDEKAFLANRAKKTSRGKASMDIIADQTKTSAYASGKYTKESIAADTKKAQDAQRKKWSAQAKKDYNKGAKK